MLLLLAVVATLGDCWISGSRAVQEGIAIARDGQPPFEVQLEQIPLALQFEPGGANLRARVRTPVAFEGTLEAARARFRIGHPITLRGLVRLAPTVDHRAMQRVHPAGHGLQIDLGNENIGVRIAGLLLPCDGLTLDDVPLKPSDTDDESPVPVEERQYLPRGDRVRVHVSPNTASDAITVEVQTRSHFNPWGRTRGDWIEIFWSHEGIAVSGWVRRRELQRIRRFTGWGFSCLGCNAGTACPRLPDGPGTSRRRARVARGARVHADPGRDPWATVTNEGPFDIWRREGEAWVAITTLPGLSECKPCPRQQQVDLQHAWVREEDLRP